MQGVSVQGMSVPSAVGRAAYRILQESITNVIRHVGPTRVTVALNTVALNPGVDMLEIRVTDEGRPSGTGSLTSSSNI